MSKLRFALVLAASTAWAAKPLPIAEVQRATPVDFEQDVLPFLSDNCLSCHCQTTTKGGLNMETPELMLKGGDSGPAVVPKKSGESLILKAAAHLDEELAMPPRDNKAKARNLTAEQLGLLRLWIDQGAIASPKRERTMNWQPLPAHLGAIFAVAVTADGQFAACSRANRIFIHHVPSGRLVASEVAHRDQVNALAFSPDGSLLASAGYREVKLWRRSRIEGQPTKPFPPVDGKITRPDGRRSVSIDGSVARLIDADRKTLAEMRGNRFARERIDECDRSLQVAVSKVAFRKEAATVAGKALQAARERTKKTADALPPKQQELAAKQKALADAKAARDAAEMALKDAGAELGRTEATLQAAVTRAAQSAAAAAEALKGPAPVDADKLATDASAALQAAAKARTDRDRAATKQKDLAAKIEAANQQFTAADEAAKRAMSAIDGANTELTLAREEERKLERALAEADAAAAESETIRKRADEALQSARQAATSAEQPIRAAAFSPDGTTLATAGDDHLVHTWGAESGAAFDVLTGHKSPVTALAFSPDGQLISTAADGTSLSWNLSPGWKLERTIGTGDAGSPFADRVNALAFSPDGRQLATGGGEPSRGGEIHIWDVSNGRPVRDFPRAHSDAVFSLEFAPDGKSLASGAADRMTRLLDPATGAVLRNLEGHTHHVLGVSWSADGRTLATAGADGVVKVWDSATGERKKNIDGYEKEVTAVRFVGTSASLLTSSGDNKIRLVSLDGKELRVFPEVADFMQSAAVSADGKLIVAGGQDSVLRVWSGEGVKLGAFGPAGK